MAGFLPFCFLFGARVLSSFDRGGFLYIFQRLIYLSRFLSSRIDRECVIKRANSNDLCLACRDGPASGRWLCDLPPFGAIWSSSSRQGPKEKADGKKSQVKSKNRANHMLIGRIFSIGRPAPRASSWHRLVGADGRRRTRHRMPLKLWPAGKEKKPKRNPQQRISQAKPMKNQLWITFQSAID